MHFSQFSKEMFSKFSKSVPPPEKNPGYAHASVSDSTILFNEHRCLRCLLPANVKKYNLFKTNIKMGSKNRNFEKEVYHFSEFFQFQLPRSPWNRGNRTPYRKKCYFRRTIIYLSQNHYLFEYTGKLRPQEGTMSNGPGRMSRMVR